MSLSLITLALTLRSILLNDSSSKIKHNTIPACSVHISLKPPTHPSESCPACIVDDDDRFIVLTETKFSIRYILVWARYSPLRTRVEAHAITLSP